MSIASIIGLMMDAASTSETSANFTKLHGAKKKQKEAIFIFVAVRTLNLT
jgi:hypothetical protein